MKILSKITALAAGLMILTTAAPALAVSTPFCTNLSTTISKVDSSMANLGSKATTARTDRSQKFTDNWTKIDSTRTSNRATWAAQRQAEYAKLEAKATTDAQKAAVTTYETTLTTAISTRQSANDAARATYRSGVQAALAAQTSTVTGQVTTFTNAVKAAETAAQNSCASTPTDTSIRTTFKASMKSAREAFTADRKTDGNVSAQVKALAATRDAAIKVNDATFQATAKAAATTLKAAFTS